MSEVFSSILPTFFIKKGLPFKIGMVTVLPVLLASLLTIFLITNDIETIITADHHRKSRELTELIAHALGNDFVFYNKALLDRTVDELAARQDTVYAIIVDAADNRVLAHSNHDHDGHLFDQAIIPVSSQMYHKTAPIVIHAREFGTLLIGFSPNITADHIGVNLTF